MSQSHHVVIKNTDGEPETYPLKGWVRKNPNSGIVDGTSHQMRAALKKKGWILVSQADKVYVIQPDENNSISYAETILEGIEDDESISSDEVLEEASEITFGLERDMQLALRQNIEQLESGLKIIDDGKERVTEIGRIDITAVDEGGNVVIIELKAGVATPPVISQILAYMSAVTDVDKKPVRGILVAGDFHKQVVFASKSISSLQLKKYSFEFKFKSMGVN